MTQAERVHAFLHRHGMHPDDLDMQAELAKLRVNMENGLAGRCTASDCKMLPTFVSLNRRPPLGEKVLTLDAGGTNLRAALVSFTADGPVIEELRTRPIPGLGCPISKSNFLRETAQFAAPLAGRSKYLGFCFSYQAEIMPDGDGKVILFSKEVQVAQSEGMLICRELLDTFSTLGIPAPTSYALVNDTVAALLGGCATRSQPCDGALGLILGTGHNVCYLADAGTIRRPIYGWNSPSMIVNMESGVYSGFPQGDFDKQLDAASMSPGTYGNEKMVGGVYQGEVLRYTLEGAAQELFSPTFRERLSCVGVLTAAHLSAFAAEPSGGSELSRLCATDEDRAAMQVITDCLLERAARLVLLSLAGPMEAENMGKTAPALVVAEGSTFWKNAALRGKIEQLSRSFLGEQLGRQCVFVGTENPNLVGAAMAALQSAAIPRAGAK